MQSRFLNVGHPVFTLFMAVIVLAACKPEQGQQGAQGQMQPAEVDVSTPLLKTITEWDEYVGRFEAVERVDLRSRVTGYLQEIRFTDGQFVEKGDVLFVIDPRPFEYALERAQAQHVLAEKEYKRARKLRNTQAISQEDLDRRQQELRAAEASLRDAELDVEYTEVRSPIDGKVSRDFINVGNLVRENDTILTRLVSIDPIHFYFEANQNQLLKYKRMEQNRAQTDNAQDDVAHDADGPQKMDAAAKPVYIRLQDEEKFVHAGQMDFIDNVIDPGTGTIQGRAIVPNDDRVIVPGMFGRVRVSGSAPYEAILIPDIAVQTDQDKKFVYVVNDQNQAVRKYIALGPIRDSGFYIVQDGLTPTDRVVVNGTQRIRMPEQPVKPVPTDLHENGVFAPGKQADDGTQANAKQADAKQGGDDLPSVPSSPAPDEMHDDAAAGADMQQEVQEDVQKDVQE